MGTLAWVVSWEQYTMRKDCWKGELQLSPQLRAHTPIPRCQYFMRVKRVWVSCYELAYTEYKYFYDLKDLSCESDLQTGEMVLLKGRMIE